MATTLDRVPTPADPLAVPHLQPGALTLFGTVAGTLANLAPGMTIFLSITGMVAAMGSRAPWGYAMAALAMLTAGNTMAQFARVLPSAGSFVTYITHGASVVSPRAGRLLGGVIFYLLVLSLPITVAAVLVFLGSWLAALVGWTAPGAWLVLALAAVALVLPLLVHGVVLSSLAACMLFIIDLTALCALAVGVARSAGPQLAVPLQTVGGTPGGFTGLAGLPFALAVFGYIGWENSGPLAEESVNPRRTIPLTILISILGIGLVYVMASWAAVAGFAAQWGPIRGIALLGSPADVAPFLALARHSLPWIVPLLILAGITSPLGCVVAAVTAQARVFFNGAREGLLPAAIARVNGQRVPAAAILLYLGLIVVLCVGPALWPGSTPQLIATLEASIGTVPLLLVYLVANAVLPLYMWRTHRASFHPLTHLAVPLLGIAVLAYGIYAFVQPDQAAPANTFWLWIGALLGGSVVGTAVLVRRRPTALDRVGSVLAE